MEVKRKKARKYTGPMQHFHNYEHDPTGLNHCKSNGKRPYTIEHVDGKHKISAREAVGHGMGGKPQLFCFHKRLGDGYDMASGTKVQNSGRRLIKARGNTVRQKRGTLIRNR